MSLQTTALSISPLLALDPAREAARIEEAIREMVLHRLRRRGAVIGVSGGIDSSVVAFLCARALGPERTFLLFLPERDNAPESLAFGEMVARSLGAPARCEPIGAILEAAGCYRRCTEAVQSIDPGYTPEQRMKIVLPSIAEGNGYSLFRLVVQRTDGTEVARRLTLDAYLGILSAMNFKQRVRKMMEYHHADRLQYAVAGTPNRLEYDQGFFVKQGDGMADFKPIAHLYKSQVYQLAEYLGVPAPILQRVPTTDTYSLEQTQEEFYFSMPLEQFDACLYGRDHQLSAESVAEASGLSVEMVERAWRRIDTTRAATRYLHTEALLVEGETATPVD